MTGIKLWQEYRESRRRRTGEDSLKEWSELKRGQREALQYAAARLKSLEEVYDQVVGELKASRMKLATKVKLLLSQIETLEADAEAFEDNEALRVECDQIKRENEAVRDQLSRTQQEVRNALHTVAAMKGKYSKLSQELKELKWERGAGKDKYDLEKLRMTVKPIGPETIYRRPISARDEFSVVTQSLWQRQAVENILTDCGSNQ